MLNYFKVPLNLLKRKETEEMPPATDSEEDALADEMRNPVKQRRKRIKRRNLERHRDELAEEPEEIIDDSEDDLAVKNLRDRATLKFTNANGPYGNDLAPPPNQQQRERPPFKATTEPCAHRTDTAKPQQDDRLKSAKAEIRSLKTANSEYRDLNAHLESQLEATNNAYSNAWNNLSEALTEIDRLNTVASEAHASHSQLSQEHAQLQKHCAELKNRLKGTENALSKTKSLLATRTEELDLAQAFMTTADRVSVADVKRMVSRLNDDIFQCAMSLSDSLLERKTSWQRECALAPEASMQAREEARKHLVTKYGEPLVVRLENESRAEETSILFESLVQSVWVYRCWSTIKRFYYTDHNVEKVLRELWERVKASSADPSIARNWLSITGANLTAPTHIPLPPSTLTTTTLDALLLVAGLQPPSPSPSTSPPPHVLQPQPQQQQQQQPQHQTFAALQTLVREKTNELTLSALAIKTMLTEEVVSAELEVLGAATNAKGNSPFKAWLMEDAHPDSRGGPGPSAGAGGEEPKVVCATALGLCCHTAPQTAAAANKGKEKVDLKGGGGSATITSKNGVRRETVVSMKVKVLLTTRLDEVEADVAAATREREREQAQAQAQAQVARGSSESPNSSQSQSRPQPQSASESAASSAPHAHAHAHVERIVIDVDVDDDAAESAMGGAGRAQARGWTPPQVPGVPPPVKASEGVMDVDAIVVD